jgi:hypothetical protein
MPRSLCCIVLLLIVSRLSDRAWADLRCTPTSADLGEIRGGTPAQHRFTLVNDGRAPIDIVEVERGCGCMQVRLDRQTLRPGEKVSLLVELRTSGQPNGPRSWNLRVRYRDGDSLREALLVIGATIRNDVTVEPPILAMHVKDTLRQTVVVTDYRSPPLKVTVVRATSPAVHATVQSAKDGVTRLLLEVAASALAGDRQDAILNIYTDDPAYSPLQLPITLTRAGNAAITVTPPQVEAHVSLEQPVASALVRLRRADGLPVAITAVDADDVGVTCTWAAGPGTQATVKVQIDARRLGDRSERRTVRIRAAEQVGVIPVMIDR